MARDTKRHGFPMPRTAFVLLLISSLLAVIPHVERVPSWMLVAFVGVFIWRIQVFRQRWPFPGKSIRLLLVALGFAAIILHHGTVFGPDAGVGLLITAYLFKQLEMVTRRDAFLVVILSYFVLATQFLFSSSIFTTLYVLSVLVIITATQVALNHSGSKVAVLQPLRVSLLLIGQSIPLMIAMFLLFPRIGPLWQLNLSNKQNAVGLSDRMSPGDMSDLALSGKLAFRAEFDGPVPPMRERYWRAAIFDQFDGRTWYAAQDVQLRPLDGNQLYSEERHYQYRVTLEPTGQRWLMVMPAAIVRAEGVHPTSLLTYLYKEEINSVLSYDVTSYPDYQFQANGLWEREVSRNLQLPASGNDKSRRYAREQFVQLGRSPERFVDSLLDWFKEEEFYYSLKPPLLGSNVVDEFLFGTRKGYCAHYAGAFVFLLRSVGIPARVVAGYMGGEQHPLGKYLLVRQYDAHAWAEVWMAGKGWVRIDPTGAVAPNRIEFGASGISDESFIAESPLSPERLRNMALFAQARMFADYIDYLWVKNVVGFDSKTQSRLFESVLGQVTPQKIAALFGGVAAVITLTLIIGILLRQPRIKPLDRIDRLYLRFCAKLASKGLSRGEGEGPMAYAERISGLKPELESQIREITTLYVTLKYTECENIQQQSGGFGGTLVDLQSALRQQVRAFKI